MVSTVAMEVQAGFPPPPPQWRLFRPGGPVHVAPPKPPTGPCLVFGQSHSLDPPPPAIEPDEWLCDLAADDLGVELRRVYGLLQRCSVDLMQCLVRSPSEHQQHLRRLSQIVRNLVSLLHTLRARESRALVLQSLKRQVARKRTFTEAAKVALPRLEARLARAVQGTGDAASEVEEEEEDEDAEVAPAAPPAHSSEPSSEEEDDDDFDSVLLGWKRPKVA